MMGKRFNRQVRQGRQGRRREEIFSHQNCCERVLVLYFTRYETPVLAICVINSHM
jgi:hypothetical protein